MKILKEIKNKLFCPLVSALIQICILYFIFFQYSQYLQNNRYDYSVANSRIKSKIEEKINYCGKDYWISWIVLSGNKSTNKYFFQDVIGCNPNKNSNNCAFSVKEAKLNEFYNQEYHKIDPKTYNFLMKIDTGVAGFYSDMSFFNDYPAIKNVLINSNKVISTLGITVTKDIRRNIVYVFAMSNTSSKLSNKCDKNKIVNTLEEISIFAGENL